MKLLPLTVLQELSNKYWLLLLYKLHAVVADIAGLLKDYSEYSYLYCPIYRLSPLLSEDWREIL
jgi:hypothetical protein